MANEETVIYLFSINSDNCTDLQQKYFTHEHKDYIRAVCIDNPKIREMLNKSKNIKINYVPCFLQVNSTGNVAKYEADDAFDFITAYNHRNKIGPLYRKSAQVNEDGRHQTELRPGNQLHPQPRTIVHPPVHKILATNRDFDPVTGQINRPQREEGYEVRRNIPHVEVEDEEEIDEPDVPMLRSILKKADDKPSSGKTVTIGKGKHVKIIQDITEDFEEKDDESVDDDPSGMNVPREMDFEKGGSANINTVTRGTPGAGALSSAAKKKSHDLKKMAEEMSNDRKKFDSQFDNDPSKHVFPRGS